MAYKADGIVHVKERTVERKLKDGSIKNYDFRESSVKLSKNHEFYHEQQVIVMDTEDYYMELTETEKKFHDLTENYTNNIENLKKVHENEITDLEHTHNLLTNKYRELNVRLDKSYDEIKDLEERNRELESRGFFSYLRRKIKRPALKE